MSVKMRKKKPSVQKSRMDFIEQAACSSISEHLPPGHNFYKEIGSLTIDAFLVFSLKQTFNEDVSPEKFLRNYIIQKIKNRELSKLASREYAQIILMDRKNPLDRVVTRCMEVIYEEYKQLEIHLKNFEDISYLDRYRNTISSFEKAGWALTPIEPGFRKEFLGDEDRLFYPAKIDGFFNEKGQIIQSFSISFKTLSGFDCPASIAFENGLLSHFLGRKNTYYSSAVFPDNNVPGIPFIPDSIKKKSRID